MKFADGTPALQADLSATTVGKFYGYASESVGPGESLVAFKGPGTYCISVHPGGSMGGYPTFTLSGSGELIWNGDDNSYAGSPNTACSIKMKTSPRTIDVVFPVFTQVSGIAQHGDGSPCTAAVSGFTSKMGADTDALNGGTFTLHLMAGKWTISALDWDNEYGPKAPSKSVIVGATSITGLVVVCGGTGG